MPIQVNKLKEYLVKNNIKGLALDIDDTLSQTLKLWCPTLFEKFGNPENISPEELVRKYKSTFNVPYWQSEEITTWILEHVNSDEAYAEAECLENALQSVLELHKHLPVVAYISTRPECVIGCSKKWLDTFGFPDAPLIHRPESVDIKTGSAWKANILEYLTPHVVGIVDDNPGLVKYLGSDYQGKIFLIGLNEYEPTACQSYPCGDWNFVLKKIKEEFEFVEG